MMSNRARTTLERSSVAVLLAAISTNALAQEIELEEVVVTAQHRSQDLQNVPVAVSALSAETVAKQDIHDLTGIATRVPGLTFSAFSPGQNIVALRGVSSNDDGAGTDNSVAMFVDGVYLGRSSNINPELFDVERIEVLRGPQGTLYGRNTIGGAINIYTKKPNTEKLDTSLTATLGNYNRTDFLGSISGPMNDSWSAKLSASTRKRDGWVDNVVLHKKQKDEDTQAVRGQLMYRAEDTEVIFGADWDQLDVGDMARIPLTQITGNLGPIVDEYNALCQGRLPKCSTNPSDGFAKRTGYGFSVTLNTKVAAGELTSITAYRNSDANWAMDSIGVAIPLTDRIIDKTHQVTQEVRWAGNTGAWNYLVGVWYSRENTDRTEIFDILSDGNFDSSDRYTQINQTDSAAVFGQTDWSFADDWSLTLGGRYSHDKKNIENSTNDGDFSIISQTFTNSRDDSWGAFTPKVSINFRPTRAINTYFSVAQGFKSGGYAAAPQREVDTAPLKQEKALNYELGLKAEPTRYLRLNTALFYTRYKDLQIQSFGPVPGCNPNVPNACFGVFETFNAGDAVAKGAEVEGTWLPIDNLSIGISYGYLDSRFIHVFVPNSAYPNQNGQDMLRAPKNKYSATVDYTWPLQSAGKLNFNANYRYTGHQRNELEPYAVQQSFALLDSRVAWVSAADHWEVAAWCRNVADKAYVAHEYTVAGEVVGVFGEPRMYGLSFTWRM